MITYVQGDIFKGTEDVIVHGCNCLCKFKRGIALQVARLYPQAYDADKATTRGDVTKLGTYTQWEGRHYYDLTRTVTIINAYTQFYPSVKMKPFDYNAFFSVLLKIKDRFSLRTIAMPKIGAGLAGGDWERIAGIINDVFPDKEIKIYVL